MAGDSYRGIPVLVGEPAGDHVLTMIFRVGVGDERLVERGVTHLLEHLGLFGLSSPHLQVNGTVDTTWCRFFASGSPEHLWSLVDHVGSRLSSLDEDTVRRERRVLAVEGQRSTPFVGEHHVRRFGAAGPGVLVYPEYGLEQMDVPTLASWRDAYFTADNVLIWSTAPPPSDGDERAILRPGSPRLPELPEPIVSGPGFFRLPATIASVSGIVSRSIAARIAVDILTQRLEDLLRHQAGFSYAVQGGYEPLTADLAHVIFVADAERQIGSRASGLLWSTIQAFLESGPTSQELDAARARAAAFDDRQGAQLGWLDYCASSMLLGRPKVQSQAELGDERANLTVAEVTQSLLGIGESGIWQVPHEVAGPPGLSNLDVTEVRPLGGLSCDYLNIFEVADTTARLEYADRQVALRDPRGSASVSLDDLAGSLRYGDGNRVLISNGGHRVHVEPSRWRRGHAIVAEIDRDSPSETRLDMGYRLGPPIQPIAPSNYLTRAALSPIVVALGFLAGIWAAAAGAVLAAVALGVLVVSLAALMLRESRVQHPVVYDDVAHRATLPGLPPNLGHLELARWSAPILLWAATHDRLRPEVEHHEADLLAGLRAGAIAPEEVVLRLGGVVSSDLFDDDANEFLHDVALRRLDGAKPVGLTSYPEHLALTARRRSADAFVAVDDPQAVRSAADFLGRTYEDWRRHRGFHRLARALNARQTSRLGAGTLRYLALQKHRR